MQAESGSWALVLGGAQRTQRCVVVRDGGAGGRAGDETVASAALEPRGARADTEVVQPRARFRPTSHPDGFLAAIREHLTALRRKHQRARRVAARRDRHRFTPQNATCHGSRPA